MNKDKKSLQLNNKENGWIYMDIGRIMCIALHRKSGEIYLKLL